MLEKTLSAMFYGCFFVCNKKAGTDKVRSRF